MKLYLVILMFLFLNQLNCYNCIRIAKNERQLASKIHKMKKSK